MYLCKLDIFGFKSFALKTSVVFNDGITAIVGPNGCGKTNIVDALRWALGEQRYSVLRSDRMEDVIFNGTKARKSVGMAEVSVTVQNNKGVLPLEYSELTITRRLYRSGESEYFLNGTQCRLKDIQSLFMDTGMGPNAYSVIELKMVESILNDKVEERRKLFEEAAGVTKYKIRRKETLKKLEDIEADLVRLDDIISEVSRSVNSLIRQSKKAERYNHLIERLRSLEIDVIKRDYTTLAGRLGPLAERLKADTMLRFSIEENVIREEAQLQSYRVSEREIENRLDSARGELALWISKIMNCEQDFAVNAERERNILETIQRLQGEKESYTRRIEEMQRNEAQAVIELEKLENELAIIERDEMEHRSIHTDLESVVSQKKLDADRRRSLLLQVHEKLSQVQSEIDRYATRMEAAKNRLEKLAEDENRIASALQTVRERLSREKIKRSGILESAVRAEQKFHEMEERKQALRAEIDRLQNISFDLQGKIGERMTQLDFLSGLVSRFEGYPQSVQYLLQNREWSVTDIVTVADVVDTKETYRAAIEAALTEAAQYIVVHDIAEAITGLYLLKDQRKGRATFVCLSRIPESVAIPFSIAGEGIFGWAIDLISCPTTYLPLFQFLLRNVLIVRDAETAHRCMREHRDIRCVTLDGDLFDSNGLVRGGSNNQEEVGIIGKKEKISRLEREVQELKAALVKNQQLVERKVQEYESIDLKEYAENMKQSQQDLSTFEQHTAQMIFEEDEYVRTLSKITDERALLIEEYQRDVAEHSALLPALERCKREKESMEIEIEMESCELHRLEEEYSRSMTTLNDKHLARVGKSAEIQNILNQRDHYRDSFLELHRLVTQTEQEIVDARRLLEALLKERTSTQLTLEQWKEERRSAEERVRSVEKTLSDLRHVIEERENVLHGLRQDFNRLTSIVHETELKIEEIRHRMATLEQRARDEFELSSIETEDLSGEEDVFDLSQAKEEINVLREKIRTLGPVNPLAFEEWRKEKERLDLLLAQREDIIESRQTLTETIQEINETAKTKFLETFNEIRKNFFDVFQSLFEKGDEADIILADGEDPLEARIDIIAKPSGKRPHSIEMLSQGEKTLTAIALLFSIYLVKPSPFCILDEVDAPLDDANIDRFLRILRSFSDNIQFIIVTHNKKTMAAADTLYGVTMEEEGVSKIVAVNFTTDAVSQFIHN
ncbi:MAG: chromosome segregation protein SMC [Bacteroidota bacterium]|nr:chromosome segregation protein SMC [Bacteroidota bacterium]